jgi:hypothetical protein
MPRGDSAEQEAARQRYWIERGNRRLAQAGKHHLQWCGKDGHHWIEERPQRPKPGDDRPFTVAEIVALPRWLFAMGKRNGFFEPDALREAERLMRKERKAA